MKAGSVAQRLGMNPLRPEGVRAAAYSLAARRKFREPHSNRAAPPGGSRRLGGTLEILGRRRRRADVQYWRTATCTPEVAVVIATKGRAELLAGCLHPLTAQSLPPEHYEVIVVDDGPHSATRSAVERAAIGSAAPIRYVVNDSGRSGLPTARSVGWRATGAPVIAFTDDDAFPDPCWLEEGLAAFRTPSIAGVWGRIIEQHGFGVASDGAAHDDVQLITANCFYRREVLEAVAEFDARFPLTRQDDADLNFTLRGRTARIERAPSAVVVRPDRPAEREAGPRRVAWPSLYHAHNW